MCCKGAVNFMGLVNKMKKNHLRTKLLIAMVVTFVIFVCLFVCFNMKYENLFFDNTYVNGIEISDMTQSEANEYISEILDKQNVEIIDKQGKSYQYSLKNDFNVTYELTSFLKEVKEEEDNLNIFSKLFSEKRYSLKELTFDEDKFNSVIKESQFYKDGNDDKTTNAKEKYDENTNKFVVQSEYQGTNINLTDFKASIEKMVSEGVYTFDLASGDYYVQPTILSDDKDLSNKVEALNKYIGASITYDMANGKEVCDASVYNKWLEYNGKEVTINSSKVKKYISSLASKYNTSGKSRTFKTTSRGTRSFSSSNFGYKINQSKEYEKLIKNIKDKETVTREPVYSQKEISGNNGFGSTYVEIDLTNQKVYLYKQGSLILTTDCVTGKVTSGHATPSGIYKITYKKSPAVLRGAIDPKTGEREYETPVTYWMPFNGGIGLHDASWRNKFGGEIYVNSGSHGCVNLPTSSAAAIYSHVSSGTPVILYK